MAAYLITDLEVTDPAVFAEYQKRAGPTLAPYGGKPLVINGRAEVLEGNFQPKSLMVVEFESLEKAKQWYDSQEYREPKAMRQRSANCNMIVVEGLPAAAASGR